MSDELNECYVLLGVAPTASAQELKAAYRDLAKVWHPDRFSHDPRLQQKAQEKLKAIKEVYDLLTSGKAVRRPARTPSPAGGPHETKPPRRGPGHFIPAMAAVFGAAFFAASMFLLFRTGEQPRHASTSSAPQSQTAPGVEAVQTGGGDAPAAAGKPARRNEPAAPQVSRETQLAGDTEPAQETAAAPQIFHEASLPPEVVRRREGRGGGRRARRSATAHTHRRRRPPKQVVVS